eukprot:CCRYP_004596-RA/>CCRYP_004596-RA protein AED:0.32 eAED:0.32 QI:81/1/1/1/0/0/2/115/45
MLRTGEFFPPLPRSHSIHLSPSGNAVTEDVACSFSPRLVPKKGFL